MKRVWSAVVACLLAGCGSVGSGREASGWYEVVSDPDVALSPLGFDDAVVVAGALELNSTRDATRFVVKVGSDEMVGSVNWADVSGVIEAGPLTDGRRVTWSESGTDVEVDEWVFYLIRVVMAFGSSQSDNPSLLLQDGTAVIADDGAEVSVAVQGNRDVVIAVDRESGLLTRAMLVTGGASRRSVLVTFGGEA